MRLQTTKKDAGVNAKKYLILHHTWGGTFEWSMNYLANRHKDPQNRQNTVSCHFVVWQNWESGIIGTPDDIQRHAGESRRWSDVRINNFWLGIEFVDSNRTFTQKQFNTWLRLIVHLMRSFGITHDRVLTHAMITNWKKSIEMKNRAPGDKSRKTDVDPSFWQSQWFDNFNQFREYLHAIAFGY